MRREVRILAVLAAGWILCAGAEPARAWTPATRIRIVDEAIRFMPPSLRLALERYREDVRRGMLEPLKTEDAAPHLPPSQKGSIDTEIPARMDAVVAAAGKPRAFRELAKSLGALAHFVSDAGFPPGAGGVEGADRYADFGKFCESRLPRFRLVFGGHDDPFLGADDARGFARAILDEAIASDAELERAYTAAGPKPDSSAFDDRSVPFAVGALSYSKTVTYVVRAWLSAWGRAQGDLARTPYLKSIETYRR